MPVNSAIVRCSSQQAHAHTNGHHLCLVPHMNSRPVLCCRFWVLSARLNQNFNAWILTPAETTKARQHNVYSTMFVVTEPLQVCMNLYLPLTARGGDKAMCQRIHEALATQSVPGAPERTLVNANVRPLLSSLKHDTFSLYCSVTVSTYVQDLPTVLSSFPEVCAQATGGFLRLVVTRNSCSGDYSKLLESILEFVILFPDLIQRWLIQNKMLLKQSMRQQLDHMRNTLEHSSQRDCERIVVGHCW